MKRSSSKYADKQKVGSLYFNNFCSQFSFHKNRPPFYSPPPSFFYHYLCLLSFFYLILGRKDVESRRLRKIDLRHNLGAKFLSSIPSLCKRALEHSYVNWQLKGSCIQVFLCLSHESIGQRLAQLLLSYNTLERANGTPFSLLIMELFGWNGLRQVAKFSANPC